MVLFSGPEQANMGTVRWPRARFPRTSEGPCRGSADSPDNVCPPGDPGLVLER